MVRSKRRLITDNRFGLHVGSILLSEIPYKDDQGLGVQPNVWKKYYVLEGSGCTNNVTLKTMPCCVFEVDCLGQTKASYTNFMGQNSWAIKPFISVPYRRPILKQDACSFFINKMRVECMQNLIT